MIITIEENESRWQILTKLQQMAHTYVSTFGVVLPDKTFLQCEPQRRRLAHTYAVIVLLDPDSLSTEDYRSLMKGNFQKVMSAESLDEFAQKLSMWRQLRDYALTGSI